MSRQAGSRSPQRRVNVLGVGVCPLTRHEALAIVEEWIAHRERQYVCVCGIHGIMECQRDERLRAIHNSAGMVTTDGMPLVWLSWLNGFRQAQRVYGPDLLLDCCSRLKFRDIDIFFMAVGRRTTAAYYASTKPFSWAPGGRWLLATVSRSHGR